jgi:hypothetical protein
MFSSKNQPKLYTTDQNIRVLQNPARISYNLEDKVSTASDKIEETNPRTTKYESSSRK